MDYLRRLHPQHARRADAARPDLGALRAAAPPAPPVVAMGVARIAGDEVGPLLAAPGLDAAMPAAQMSTVRPAQIGPQFATPGALHGDRAAMQSTRAPMADARSARALSPSPLRIDGGAEVESARPEPAATAAATRADAASPSALREHSPSTPPERTDAPAAAARAAAPALAALPRLEPLPLRLSTTPLRPLQPAAHAAPAPPPVVHVSIERIDVRIPGPPAAAALPRKPRAGASQSLTDYLRGSGRRES